MESVQATKSKRTHRVGSVTFGIILVLFGVLFLINSFFPALEYSMILQFWPCILIFLGLEVLVSIKKEGTTFTYDGMAIFLTMALMCFSFLMAYMNLELKSYFFSINCK